MCNSRSLSRKMFSLSLKLILSIEFLTLARSRALVGQLWNMFYASVIQGVFWECFVIDPLLSKYRNWKQVIENSNSNFTHSFIFVGSNKKMSQITCHFSTQLPEVTSQINHLNSYFCHRFCSWCQTVCLVYSLITDISNNAWQIVAVQYKLSNVYFIKGQVTLDKSVHFLCHRFLISCAEWITPKCLLASSSIVKELVF